LNRAYSVGGVFTFGIASLLTLDLGPPDCDPIHFSSSKYNARCDNLGLAGIKDGVLAY